MNNKYKSIIYVNFSPYENTGKILDFLIEHFDVVILFLFHFHSLGKNQERSKVKIFRKSKLIKEYPLFQLPVPMWLLFPLLPLRSFLISLQFFYYTSKLKKEFGEFDIYFTVNAFTAWMGNILKSFGVVKKTVFWIWDYYPPIHENKIIMLMRWIYWQFDKLGTSSDKVVFLNDRIRILREDIGILPKNIKYTLVPIGTNPQIITRKKNNKKIVLGFLGVVKKSQGLDIVFDNSETIIKMFPGISLEIIGSGPDESYFRERAKQTRIPVTFYGFHPMNRYVEKIMQQWDIGVATYIPEESNVSYYGDPSKIKAYFNYGIPVITTDVFIFSNEIKKEQAGIIIRYEKPHEFVTAIKKILEKYNYYKKNVISLARKYEYKKIYPTMFEFEQI